MAVSDETLTRVADEVFALMRAPREVSPYTSRFPGYDLEDAYASLKIFVGGGRPAASASWVGRLASQIPRRGLGTYLGTDLELPL